MFSLILQEVNFAPSQILASSRDQAGVFAFFIVIFLVKAQVWLIGRYSVDNDWWKATIIGMLALVLSVFSMGLFSTMGVQGVAGGAVVCIFTIWIVAGFVYEMEAWQRAVTALVSPVLGGGSYFAGGLIRDGIGNLG